MTVIEQAPSADSPSPEPSASEHVTTLPMQEAFTTLGEMAVFGVQTVAGVPTAIKNYPTEIIRQAALLVRGSSAVLLSFTLIIGLEAALIGGYMLGGLGAQDYIGLFIAIAVVQAISAPTFGWIFSAKVGCGYAAELGTMRISEEIDALQVMGMQPRAYLASTRLVAIWLVVPFIWLAAAGTMMIGSYVMSQLIMNTASPGGYSEVFWSFQQPAGIFLALTWAMVTCTAIGLVSCYFGYNAAGGPVGVGRATALSMMVNMVLVSVFTGILYQLFFGINIDLPIAN